MGNITTLPPTTPTIDDCKDILEEAVCQQKKKEKKCNKDNVQVNCKKTCDQCSPPPTTQPTPTDCEGVEKDEESLDFCENKKKKNKCEQFKKECLVTCGFCNPNITTLQPNITTLQPNTTAPPMEYGCDIKNDSRVECKL